jgi:hypothetical protein
MPTPNTTEPVAEKAETKPNKPVDIRHRFIGCWISAGRFGKSLTCEGLKMWLDYAQVDHLAIDADPQHRTFSRRHPEDVNEMDAARSNDEFGALLQSAPDAPVILVDYPAQATDFLIQASRQLQLIEVFESRGIRPTLLIFAADDESAKESASAVVHYFGDRADYLLIENPARFKSEGFKKTKFYRWFLDRQTPTLRIPTITVGTMALWQKLEREEKRHLSFDKVRQHPKLDIACRMELDYVRNRFLVQCEDHASLLVPDLGLIKKKVTRPNAPQPVAVNPLEDEFFS